VLSFDLKVEPDPSFQWTGVDREDNGFDAMVFTGTTDTLSLASRCEVETLHENPFDYLLDSSALTLPMTHDPDLEIRLAPYLHRTGNGNGVIGSFARRIAEQVDWQTAQLPVHLARRIQELCVYEEREKGDPLSAEATLANRKGSCRDFAVLMMESARSLGLAARFVSGYQEAGFLPDAHKLHAWTEIYLPGAGWRGFDPSTGLAVCDRHIAVAAGPHFHNAAPVQGTFGGAWGRANHPEVQINIQNLDPQEQSQAQTLTA